MALFCYPAPESTFESHQGKIARLGHPQTYITLASDFHLQVGAFTMRNDESFYLLYLSTMPVFFLYAIFFDW